MTHSSNIHSSHAKAAAEYLAGWQRSRAELDNFRKRIQASQGEQQVQQLRIVLEPILSLNDNFRAMITNVPADLNKNAWVSGVLHVARQLHDTLIQLGVSIIEEKGGQFDPRLHEAIDHVTDTEAESGTVMEILQAGYQLKDKILRPAKVKVAA